MKYGLEEEVVHQINNVFANYEKVTSAILYGSRAKGTFHSGSDIDLALQGQGLRFQDVLQIKLKLEELNLPYETDVCILKQVNNQQLVDHIQRVGVVFYGEEASF